MAVTYDKAFLADLNKFLTDAGYETLTAWMNDSDYLLGAEGYWVDLDDNPVEPFDVVHAAMEASGFYDTTTDLINEPLTTAQISERLDSDGYVTGNVPVDASDLIDNDLEGVLDLLSEKLVGTTSGMNINYQPVAVLPDGTISMSVTLDPTLILADQEN